MSKRFRLNWRDVGKGVVVAILGTFTGGIVTALQAGTVLSMSVLQSAGVAGLVSGLAYIQKNLLTDDAGKLPLEK